MNLARFFLDGFFFGPPPCPGGISPLTTIPCLPACHSFAFRPLERQNSAKLSPLSCAWRKCFRLTLSQLLARYLQHLALLIRSTMLRGEASSVHLNLGTMGMPECLRG
jgi:hypothetical protein